MIVTFGGEVKTYRDMKTEIKNFPRGLDVKDLLYLIWRALCGDKGESPSGGGEGGAAVLPVEANPTIEEGDVTTALESLRIGDSKYTIGGGEGEGCTCLAPMVVAGTQNDGTFTPGDGAATWAEAREQMFSGGLLYLLIVDDGEPVATALASYAGPADIVATTDDGNIVWAEGEGEGE